MTDATHSLLQPHDREFYERELASFIPDRVFDAHTHIWTEGQVPWKWLPSPVGREEYLAYMQDLHPGRETGALFLSWTHDRAMIAAANEWTAAQVEGQPLFRGLYFVTPEDDPEHVREEVRRMGLTGLKCYHTMAAVTPTWEAGITDFLPEPLMAVAHEEQWVVTLHMVRSRAVADPGNIECIRRCCEKYPGMRLVLAHSARGFQPAHNLEGLPQLVGLDNLWFDTSANCEPIAHQAVLRYFGHERLMYGSDLPVSHLRGRSVSVADSFLWMTEETPVWEEKHQRIEPVLTGLEHLRSVRQACWSERLSDAQVEDIFWNNAAGLLGIEA